MGKKFIGLDWSTVGSGQTVMYSGGTWEAKTLAGGEIGPARDGTYTDGLLPWTDTEKVGFALDDVNEILSLLAPTPPVEMNTTTLTIQGPTYTAKILGATTTVSNITVDPTPQINVENEVPYIADANTGTIVSQVDEGS